MAAQVLTIGQFTRFSPDRSPTALHRHWTTLTALNRQIGPRLAPALSGGFTSRRAAAAFREAPAGAPRSEGPALFDRSGNVGPTIWRDGRVVGGWAQRRDGEIAYRLLEDVGAEGRAAVEERASGLAEWLGVVRFTPRFRTPIERELSA
jgi:DNA glycosylase AlkZ-like